MTVHFHVGLSDCVFFGFPRRLIERVGLVLGKTLAGAFAFMVFLIDRLLLKLLAHFEMRIARIDDIHKFQKPWRFLPFE